MTNKYITHIVLLSDNVLSIALPALDYNLKPEKIILCESDAMRKKGVAERLIGFLKSHKIKVEVFNLGNADDLSSLNKKFCELASRYEKRSDEVAVNLSGGTRLISLAAQGFFTAKNFTCVYTVPRRNEVFAMRAGEIQRRQLQDKIKLNDYFKVHGYEIKSKREKNLKLMSGSHALCRELTADFDKYGRHVVYLGRLAYGAENHFSLKAKAKITLDNTPLFELFRKHGFISSFDEGLVKFASEDDRSFCKGIWLRDYLHQTLKSLSKEAGLRDFATCVDFVSRSGSKYEFDAGFLCRNKLFVIKSNTSRKNERGANNLFEKECVKNFSAECIQPIVISLGDLKSFDLKRASKQGIELIQSSELNEIDAKIKALLGDADLRA